MAKRKKERRTPKPQKALRQVLRPGYDNRMEPVSDRVDDPYEPEKLTDVVRNVRECSLLAMMKRRQIDAAQFRAGEWVRTKIEQSRMSTGAIDPSNEPVDISGHADPIPDRVIMAAQAVSKARAHIGAVSWPLLQLVCGDGHTIEQAAHRRYGAAKRGEIEFTGKLLRETLDELAVYLGYAAPKHHRGSIEEKSARSGLRV